MRSLIENTIYSLCKSLSVRDTYAGKEIGSMILDDRSKYRYPKGCFGNRIIEATVDGRLYNDEKKEVNLASPINSKNTHLYYRFQMKIIIKRFALKYIIIEIRL